MAEFKEGDIVYHKATLKRGVISKKSTSDQNAWLIVWQDSENPSHHYETELWTEEEEKQFGKESK